MHHLASRFVLFAFIATGLLAECQARRTPARGD